MQLSTYYSTVTVSFLLCFSANPLDEVLHVFLLCQICAEESNRGLCLCLLLVVCCSHLSVLATSCFPQDWSLFSSSSCPWCSLRHHHLGHIAGENQFCCSTSRNPKEEKGGTPYLRSSEGSQETGHSCQSR